jgi:hypothetical protein
MALNHRIKQQGGSFSQWPAPRAPSYLVRPAREVGLVLMRQRIRGHEQQRHQPARIIQLVGVLLIAPTDSREAGLP